MSSPFQFRSLANPWFLGAGLVAPLFLKDDDRGYFKTASITTPLLAGAFSAAPSLWKIAREAGLEAGNLYSNNPFQFSMKDGLRFDVRKSLKGNKRIQTAFRDMHSQASADYYSGIVHKPFDVASASANLRANLERQQLDWETDWSYTQARGNTSAYDIYKQEQALLSRRDLTSYAFQEAVGRAITPDEMIRNAGQTSVLPKNYEEMTSLLDKYGSNEQFVKTLRHRLSKNTSLVSNHAIPSVFDSYPLATRLDSAPLDSIASLEEIETQLGASLGPKVRKNLEAAMPNFENASLHFHDVLEGGVTKRKLLNMTMTNKFDKSQVMSLPLFREESGLWTVGTGRLAVMQGVRNKNGMWRGDGTGEALDYLTAPLTEKHWGETLKTAEQIIWDSGQDPLLDEFKIANGAHSDAADLSLNAVAKHSSVIKPTARAEFDGKYYKNWEHKEKKEELASLYEQGYFPHSDGDFKHGSVRSEYLTFAEPGGLQGNSRASMSQRSSSTSVQIDPATTGGFRQVPMITDVLPEVVPEVFIRKAGIAPAYIDIAGHLPEKGFHTITPELNSYMEAAMTRHAGGDETLGKEIYAKFLHRISGSEEAYHGFRENVSRIGEGAFRLSPRMNQLGLRELHTLKVQIPTSFSATENKWLEVGHLFSNQISIGKYNSAPVVGAAPMNRVVGIARHGDELHVQTEALWGMSGGKGDIGIKGKFEAEKASNTRQWQEALDTVSFLNMETGTGGVLPADVDMLTSQISDRTYNPLKTAIDRGLDVAETLENRPEASPDNMFWNKTVQDLGDQSASYKKQLLDFNFYHNAEGRLVEDSKALMAMGREERKIRNKTVVDLSLDYLERVQQGVLQNSSFVLEDNPLFYGFRQSHRANPNSPGLSDYMQQSAEPVAFRVTDSSQRNLPKETRITPDLIRQLERDGQPEILKWVLSNTTPDGDRGMTHEFVSHVVEGDFNKPLGNSISVNQLKSVQPNALEARESGALFSPETYGQNYSIDLGRDFGAGQHIPILGRDALRGGPNRFGPGDYNPSVNEKATNKLLESLSGLNTTGANDEAIVNVSLAAIKDYKNTVISDTLPHLMKDIGTFDNGVGGSLFVRPPVWDPALNGGKGGNNPFVSFLSTDRVHAIADPKLRKHILDGGSGYGLSYRYPLNAAVVNEFRHDPSLPIGTVSVAELGRTTYAADYDGDIKNQLLASMDSSINEKFKSELSNESSNTWMRQKYDHYVQGRSEEPSAMTSSMLKKELEANSLPNVLEKVMNSNPLQESQSRTAAGYIGMYDNFRTKLLVSAAQNPVIARDASKMRFINDVAMQATSQLMIAATKNKAGDIVKDDILNPLSRMQSALNMGNETGVTKLHGVLTEMLESFKTVLPYDGDSAKELGMELPGRMSADDINLRLEMLRSKEGEQTIRDLVLNHTSSANLDTELITTKFSPHEIHTEEWANRVTKMAENFKQSRGLPAVLGPTQKASTMAERGSEALGALNNFAKGIGEEARVASKGGLKTAAIGLGIAAIAGLFSTTISSNEHRPEDRAGVADRVPGEPVTGSRSSVNPVRAEQTAKTPQKTIVAANMRSRVNLDVKVKSGDQQAAIEVEKMTKRAAGERGTTNVTVNHVGGWRNKMSSLRKKEQIREDLRP